MNFFQEIEALVSAAQADSAERARALLARFRTSQDRTTAIDEFMLDFVTLVFVIDHGEAGYEKSLRKLTLLKLEKIKRLVSLPA
ncbi:MULTISPECIES: hypothetical protein [unclassified Mesorhizobium]|uniref:hypothetical protein n=1 Tax=unclassified Mesorhizobium TaxID=325217 RepID=UPI00112E1E5F|nr:MULTISPECIES: hypothetical protein [unclassified Mesorhizobium]TPI21023.1 hypothetical protein FJW10_09780 [Mesorhizobium sp. B4-1-1]TPL54350.1 hypothetical protein FJ957_03010 [Mesorhizobium sp. B2-4-6]